MEGEKKSLPRNKCWINFEDEEKVFIYLIFMRFVNERHGTVRWGTRWGEEKDWGWKNFNFVNGITRWSVHKFSDRHHALFSHIK